MNQEMIHERISLFLTIGFLFIFVSFAMLVSAAMFHSFEVFVGGVFVLSVAFTFWLIAYTLMTKHHGDKE